MNIQATILIAVAATVVLAIGAGIAFYVGKKHNSNEDWVVGGRSLPVYVLAFTQYATAVGGGVLVAHVGIAYAWGLSVFMYELFVVAGLLILAAFAGWLRKGKFATIPEVIGRLYGSHKTLLTIVALAVIVVPFGWLATQFVAFASLFSEVTGISVAPLILAMAVISLLFVLPGGLTSVAWSDFFFGVFMIAISVVIGIYAIISAGGWGEVVSSIPSEMISIPAGFGAAGGMTILLWLFAILPGTLTNQLYFQRIFAAKSGRDARKGIYLSCVMVLLAGGYALLIGIAVRSMNGSFGVNGREEAAGWFLTQIPAWLLALYGAFLMATIVSTTGSALQSVVANMVYDLRRAYVTNKDTSLNLVRVSRWCTVGVTLAAATLAIVYPNALGWLVATYAYSASALAAPLLLGIVFHKRRGDIPASVAYVSIAAGIIGCSAAHVIGTTVPYAVYGIVASTVAYLVMVYAVKSTDSNTHIKQSAKVTS